jgi:hypothetical protein
MNIVVNIILLVEPLLPLLVLMRIGRWFAAPHLQRAVQR